MGDCLDIKIFTQFSAEACPELFRPVSQAKLPRPSFSGLIPQGHMLIHSKHGLPSTFTHALSKSPHGSGKLCRLQEPHDYNFLPRSVRMSLMSACCELFANTFFEARDEIYTSAAVGGLAFLRLFTHQLDLIAGVLRFALSILFISRNREWIHSMCRKTPPCTSRW